MCDCPLESDAPRLCRRASEEPIGTCREAHLLLSWKQAAGSRTFELPASRTAILWDAFKANGTGNEAASELAWQKFARSDDSGRSEPFRNGSPNWATLMRECDEPAKSRPSNSCLPLTRSPETGQLDWLPISVAISPVSAHRKL